MTASHDDAVHNVATSPTSCGSGCACAGGKPFNRARMIVCVVIMMAVAILVVRAVSKNRAPSAAANEASYSPAAVQAAAPAAAPAAAQQAPAAPTDKTAAPTVQEIGSLNELNTVASGTDAVLVYLPDASGAAPPAQLTSTARTIGTHGTKVGVFALKASASEYRSIAAHVPVPCVLAMVKGRGAVPVSGEITEMKLMQAFVAASSGGGCGSGGCGPVGCN